MSDFIYLSDRDVVNGWDGKIVNLIEILKRQFIEWRSGSILLPEKSSQIIDDATQSRVNCMPSTLLKDGVSGVKLVSVFPLNHAIGLPNVSGAILLLSAENGHPLAVLDAGLITALRTALIGGLAATYFAPSNPVKIGLLGAGEQAMAHLAVFAALFPSLTTCSVASRSPKSEQGLVDKMRALIPGMSFEACGGSYAKAATGADIIVTAISGQAPVLHAEWVKSGSFYCHVGGYEDEYAVALKADKIVCDSWDAIKHRGSPTISHMYQRGLLKDDDIYADLADVILGERCGREREEEIVYFNSVGLSFTDVALSYELYKQCKENGLGTNLNGHTATFFSNQAFRDALARTHA